jgi:cell wall assembly regulator SMI1
MRTHAFLKGRQHVEKRFEVELPEEVVAGFGWHEGEVPRKVREALVMELLRRDQLSEAQAAALLQLNRWELLDVMGRYQVPAMRLSLEELKRELAQEIRRD